MKQTNRGYLGPSLAAAGLVIITLVAAGCSRQAATPSAPVAAPAQPPVVPPQNGTQVAGNSGTFEPYVAIHELPPAAKKITPKAKKQHRLRLVKRDDGYYLADSHDHYYHAARDKKGRIYPAYRDADTGEYYPLHYDADRDRHYRLLRDDNKRYYRSYEDDPQDRIYDDPYNNDPAYADSRYADPNYDDPYYHGDNNGNYRSGDYNHSDEAYNYDTYEPDPRDAPTVSSGHGSKNRDAWLLAIPVLVAGYLILKNQHHNAPRPVVSNVPSISTTVRPPAPNFMPAVPTAGQTRPISPTAPNRAFVNTAGVPVPHRTPAPPQHTPLSTGTVAHVPAPAARVSIPQSGLPARPPAVRIAAPPARYKPAPSHAATPVRPPAPVVHAAPGVQAAPVRRPAPVVYKAPLPQAAAPTSTAPPPHRQKAVRKAPPRAALPVQANQASSAVHTPTTKRVPVVHAPHAQPAQLKHRSPQAGISPAAPAPISAAPPRPRTAPQASPAPPVTGTSRPLHSAPKVTEPSRIVPKPSVVTRTPPVPTRRPNTTPRPVVVPPPPKPPVKPANEKDAQDRLKKDKDKKDKDKRAKDQKQKDEKQKDEKQKDQRP